MHRCKIILFLFLLLAPIIGKSFEPYRDLRIRLAQETAKYYRTEVRIDPDKFRPFLYSACQVARIFPMYPADSEQDRMLRLFELGGLESFWTKNFIIINVPGAKYSNGVVKRVSVDFSAWGVNEDSVLWTYKVATAIQNGNRIPNRVGNWYGRPSFIKMLKTVKIPSNLKLKKIDLRVAAEAKKDYYIQRKFYRDPEAVRRVMIDRMPEWDENTQDDVTSDLIYRVLEELDRKSRGWSYGQALYAPKKHALYNHLTQFIDDEE